MSTPGEGDGAAHLRAALDALSAHIALLDGGGIILAVNEAWRRFAVANAYDGASAGVGADYIAVCERASGDCAPEARAVADGLRAVLAGMLPSFISEYPCHSPLEQRWFRMAVRPQGGGPGAVVVHVDVTDRRRAEEALRRRAELDALVARLSTRFISCRAEETNAAIADALGRVGAVVGADRAFVIRFPAGDEAAAEYAYEWCAPGIAHLRDRITTIDMTAFPWAMAQYRRGESVSISSVATMPPEAAAEQAFTAAAGAKSSVNVPMFYGGVLNGVVGYAALQCERSWSDDDLALLKVVADMIFNALERQRADEAIHALNAALEQRIVERTAALERAVRELESFSYSVSHDLRAPLRAIDGFSHALLEDYGDQLDANAHHMLERIRAGSARMSELTDALLTLAKITRGTLHRSRVDLSALARAVANELAQAHPERQVNLSIAPGLVVDADASLLRVVLQNLLGNAWKYTSPRPCAHIEVGYDAALASPAFFVRDDGVGFDMAYLDKLFNPFQRLHGPTEFEGTGIGLATVQRIIHRHGGRIWAVGAVDGGATFYFNFSDGMRTPAWPF